MSGKYRCYCDAEAEWKRKHAFVVWTMILTFFARRWKEKLSDSQRARSHKIADIYTRVWSPRRWFTFFRVCPRQRFFSSQRRNGHVSVSTNFLPSRIPFSPPAFLSRPSLFLIILIAPWIAQSRARKRDSNRPCLPWRTINMPLSSVWSSGWCKTSLLPLFAGKREAPILSRANAVWFGRKAGRTLTTETIRQFPR